MPARKQYTPVTAAMPVRVWAVCKDFDAWRTRSKWDVVIAPKGLAGVPTAAGAARIEILRGRE